MTMTSFWLLLFVATMCALPWLVKFLQKRLGRVTPGTAGAMNLISSLAVGPQQRVVMVEVGPVHARTQLVLGVTSQSMVCLHVLNPDGKKADVAVPDFAQALQDQSHA